MRTGHHRPQISLPLTFTENVDIDVTYTAASAETLTITLNGLTRYNSLDGTSSDLLTYVTAQLNAGSSHTWASADPVLTGATPGRTQITCTPTTGDVATITIPASLGLLLGFDDTTPTIIIDGADSVIESAHTRAGLWIPGPQSDVYVIECFGRSQRNGSLTMGASGPLTNDVYGTTVPFLLTVDRFAACFAFDDYADQSEFVDFDSALDAGDPNLSFEALCLRWSVSENLRARLYPDHENTNDFVTIKPGEWVNDPSMVLRKVGKNAKLRYTLNIQGYEQ